MRNQSRDPFYLHSKYPGRCAKCGAAFPRGARIFYYPNGKAAYYGECADNASGEFYAARADESFFNA